MRKKSLWICDYPKSSYVSTRNQAMELLERVKDPFIIIIIIIIIIIMIIIIIIIIIYFYFYFFYYHYYFYF